MNVEEKERLARWRDISKEACGRRLKAAKLAVGLTSTSLAEAMGEGMTVQKISNAERGDNYPSIPLLRYLLRSHRVDYNFIFHGEFAQLPADLQDQLFAQLAALDDTTGQKSG